MRSTCVNFISRVNQFIELSLSSEFNLLSYNSVSTAVLLHCDVCLYRPFDVHYLVGLRTDVGLFVCLIQQ